MLFNGTSHLPAVQSTGVFPADPDAVDMVHVDEFYDKSVADFVKGAHSRGQPFFFYFASHHTHAPQFAPCQTDDDARGADGLASNCSSPRGLFGDSLGLLDRVTSTRQAIHWYKHVCFIRL